MNEIRDLNTLFDVLNQGKASVEFVKKLAEPYQQRLEKTETLISEGRLAVYYQKLNLKDNLAELLIDEGMADRALSTNKSSAQMKLFAAA